MNPKRVDVGARFAVFPFYEGGSVEPGARIPILIGHGRAFGSGEHETTASCLEEIERIAGAGPGMEDGLRGLAVLDLGSGTGILAIAAARLGAARVTAVEPDPEAFEAGGRNFSLNGLGNAVETIRGEIGSVRGRRFDLVLANIYGDVLLPIAPDVSALLRPRARLILSGVHYDYAYDIKKAYTEAGLTLAWSRALENYCTFVLVR